MTDTKNKTGGIIGMVTRKTRDLIIEDRLRHSSSENVYAWLQESNQTGWDIGDVRDHDEEIEISLLERNDPLITLGIAQYGCSIDALGRIWNLTERQENKQSGHARALRLAILSNQSSDQLRGLQILYIMGSESFLRFLEEATPEELDAMGQNPRFPMLEALYEKDGPFAPLSEQRWMEIIKATTGNPVLSSKYEGKDADGYTTYRHSCIPRAVYALASKVPVTKEWAAILAWLFEKTTPELPFNYTVAELDATLARWRDPVFSHDGEAKGLSDPSEFLRAFYARLYFSYGINKPLEEILASEDLAVRCAAYGWAKLTPEQIKAASERDRQVFAEWATSNALLCRNEPLREAIRNAARQYGNEDLSELQHFNRFCEEQRKLKPYWFNDETVEPEIEEEPEQPDPYTVMQQAITSLSNTIESVQASLNAFRWTTITLLLLLIWGQFFE